MGILNVTPDSFYDGARHAEREAAIERARQMIEEGADIIDIGGEKAGPGIPVPLEEELRRVAPVIEALRRVTAIPISVDTFKPEVARAAVEAGAGIINSIGGFGDATMRRVALETGAAIVIMHIQGQPRVAHPYPQYADVVQEVRQSLMDRAQTCLADGISRDSIIIDPGPDFGKTTEHDLSIVKRLSELVSTGYPVLLAVSRKKFIGDVLGKDASDRLAGSLAVAAWGVMQGVTLIRTHDVKATKRVITMTEAVFHPDRVGEPA